MTKHKDKRGKSTPTVSAPTRTTGEWWKITENKPRATASSVEVDGEPGDGWGEFQVTFIAESNRQLVAIYPVLCVAESDLALKIKFPLQRCDWVPKSLVNDNSDVGEKDDYGTLIVPTWKAKDAGWIT